MPKIKPIAIIGKDRYFLRLKYFLLGYQVSLRPASRHRLPTLPTREQAPLSEEYTPLPMGVRYE